MITTDGGIKGRIPQQDFERSYEKILSHSIAHKYTDIGYL